MTDKAASSPAGWVVQVTYNAGSDLPSRIYYEAAIRDAKKAVDAAMKAAAGTGEIHAEPVRELSAAEIDVRGLKAGQVKRA